MEMASTVVCRANVSSKGVNAVLEKPPQRCLKYEGTWHGIGLQFEDVRNMCQTVESTRTIEMPLPRRYCSDTRTMNTACLLKTNCNSHGGWGGTRYLSTREAIRDRTWDEHTRQWNDDHNSGQPRNYMVNIEASSNIVLHRLSVYHKLSHQRR